MYYLMVILYDSLVDVLTGLTEVILGIKEWVTKFHILNGSHVFFFLRKFRQIIYLGLISQIGITI